MGVPKEWLELEGRACLDLVLGACREAELGRPIVVTRPQGLAAVEDHMRSQGIEAEVAVNPHPEEGQTSSLRAGLARLPAAARAFLIYPVDFPLVTGADVRRLCEAFAASPEAAVVAPSFGRRRGHPVVVDARLAPEILALPPGDSARAVIAAHEAQVRHVDFEDDRVLQDMDTPEAYAACLARLRARAAPPLG
jgi:CTP:molybdopterin cytidylyltransferase MocA